MIGESGGVSTLVSNERLNREILTGPAGRQAKEDTGDQAVSLADSVSISPEAIALARNAPPAGESSENGSSTESERQSEALENSRKRGIDIRA